MTMMDAILILSIFSAFYAVFLLVSPYLAAHKNMQKRFDRVFDSAKMQKRMRAKQQDGSILISEAGWWDNLGKNLLPKPELLRQRLERTGIKIPLGVYLLSSLIVGGSGGALCFFGFGSTPYVAIALGLASAFKIPLWLVDFIAVRRCRKFIANLPDAIDLMVRGIKSGLPISQTIRSVSQEIPNPVGEEFAKVADGIKLGHDMNQLMWERAEKLDIAEMKFFCIALSIQKETGGNLAETLGNLSAILRRRKQVELKIRAMSSEAKASAIIIGSLPPLMFMVLKLITPDYVDPLLDDPRGHTLIYIGLGMMVTGVLVMKKMVSFEI